MKDKILQGLNCCQRSECNFCPYFEDASCTDNLKRDAYNLITEQGQYISALEMDIKSFKSKGLTASAVQEIIAENERLKESSTDAYAQGYGQAKNDIIELIKSGI